MSIEKTQAQLKSKIWQAIAQGNINLSILPPDEQTKLVDALADSMLGLVNELLEEASVPIKTQQNVEVPGDDETIIWEGRPFLSLVEFYIITSERIKITRGLIGKDLENFELIRVQDIDVKQTVSERLLGIGDITITGADASAPMVVLRNVPQPNEVYELLRKAWLAARKKYGLIFREEM
jgi:hypothetical protein